MSEDPNLVDRWNRAVRGMGAVAAEADLAAAGAALVGRWSEPQRHYHDVTHLTAVLDVVDRFADLARQPDRVRVAAWMHDAIYDPRAPGDQNERDSAELAVHILIPLGAEGADDVARLVRLTAGHVTGADDPDGELLCDADLAILSADEDRYTAYAAAIRREYAHVPDEQFRAGRARVLTELLDQESIYRHAALRIAWEQRARANLIREIGVLAGEVPRP
jgi:predicted metal-dependent HD superfamily phosphohydrolase